MSIGRRLRREAARTLTAGKADLKKIYLDGRYSMPEHQFARVLDQLTPSQIEHVLESPLPKRYQDIRKTQNSTDTRYQDHSLELNLDWYIKSIGPYAKKIRSFIALKRQFESQLLQGNYNEALATIEHVNHTICHSQWAINQIIVTNEFNGGLKSNKMATGDFQSPEMDGVVKSIASFQSLRSERNLPLYRFTEILETALSEATQFDKEYYKFKLLPTNLSPLNWAMILKVDSRSSIIDRYNTFLEVCLCMSAGSDSTFNFASIRQWIDRMYQLVPDPLLYNILLIHNACTDVKIDDSTKVSCETSDQFFLGNFDETIRLTRDGLYNHPYLIELYQTYVLASLYTGREFLNPFVLDSIGYRLMQDIYNVFDKKDLVSNSLSNILKHSYAFKGANFSWEIFELFCKHHSIEGGTINVRKVAIACGALSNPDAISYPINKKLLEKHPLFNSSPTLQIYLNYISEVTSNISNITPGIDSFQRKLIEIDTYFYRKEMLIALIKIDELLASNEFALHCAIPYNKDHLRYSRLIALLTLKENGKAIDWVASANLQDLGSHDRLGNSSLIAAALESEIDEISLSIYTPIILSQYSVDYKINTNQLWIAFDNYMLGIGVDRPSQLRKHISNIDKVALIYFLRNICVQETLGKSYNVFSNEDDLDNERMAVLGLLCEIDAINFEVYVRELQLLSSNIEIRKGIKQINESKIYVDISGIQSAIGPDMRETFNRAVELDSLNVPEMETIIELLGDNFSVINVKEINNRRQLVATSAQEIKHSSNLLRYNHMSLFIKIRDAFISHSDFGLDSYISMRIRHGALTNQIRSIFDTNNLVTKRDGETGEYIWNSYWINKLDITNEANQQLINGYFADFSNDVDSLAGNLKNNLIQLSTEQRLTKGLFNFAYSESELNDLYNRTFKKIRAYDDFFNLATEELWRRTEANLHRIRESALIETQQELISSLDKLSVRIVKLSYVNDFYEFTRSITECRTQFRQEIEKIANWFKRSTSTSINDFKIDLPIKTSLSVVRKIHVGYMNFTPSQEVVSQTVFNGKYFIHLSDMFRNLFDNILTHSGISEWLLSVSLKISETDDKMSIVLSNNFSSEIDRDALNVKIQGIELMLGSTSNADRTREEGGTGYLKIQKILRSDLGCRHFRILIEPVNHDNIFTVNVDFDIKHLRQ